MITSPEIKYENIEHFRYDYDSSSNYWKCSHCFKYNYVPLMDGYPEVLKCIYCNHEFKRLPN